MKKIIKDDGFEGNEVIIIVDRERRRVYAESHLIRYCGDDCDCCYAVKFSALAKTHPDDVFDEKIGINLAERRLALKIQKYLLNEAKDYKNYLDKELESVNKYLEKRKAKLEGTKAGIEHILKESCKDNKVEKDDK